ncbi:MAG: LysM peptidoglycan-binding domain-containing protein [Clostridiales bacterium]|nr:LysM peptidoglycan-binding domain-containing protein [Clostridiales bacterium]
MENTMRISFSAVSHTGAARETNTNRIYANGKFNNSFENDNIRISLETSDSQFLFALSDGMESEGPKTSSSISISDDLKKLQQKFRNNSKDFQTRLTELSDYVQQTGNLFGGMYEDDSIENGNAFAGLVFENGRFAAIRLGEYSIFKLENDMMKPLASTQKRTERLLKMGIINDEQAEMIFGQQGAANQDSKGHLKRSDIHTLREGDTFLICSKGITDSVGEDAIFDIVSSNSQIDEASALLVKEAVGNFGSDNMTAIMLRVEELDEVFGTADVPAQPVQRQQVLRRAARVASEPRESIDFKRILTSAAYIIIAATVLFGGFTIWMNLRNLPGGTKTAGNSAADSSAFLNDSGKGGLDSEGASVDPSKGSTNPATGGSITDQKGSQTPDIQGGIAGATGEDSTEAAAAGASSNKGTTDSAAGNGTASQGAASGSGTTVAANSTVNLEGASSYTVKSGDSLMSISRKFYGSQGQYKLIMKANGLDNPDKIFEGQVLKIPVAQ